VVGRTNRIWIFFFSVIKMVKTFVKRRKRWSQLKGLNYQKGHMMSAKWATPLIRSPWIGNWWRCLTDQVGPASSHLNISSLWNLWETKRTPYLQLMKVHKMATRLSLTMDDSVMIADIGSAAMWGHGRDFSGRDHCHTTRSEHCWTGKTVMDILGVVENYCTRHYSTDPSSHFT